MYNYIYIYAYIYIDIGRSRLSGHLMVDLLIYKANTMGFSGDFMGVSCGGDFMRISW